MSWLLYRAIWSTNLSYWYALSHVISTSIIPYNYTVREEKNNVDDGKCVNYWPQPKISPMPISLSNAALLTYF